MKPLRCPRVEGWWGEAPRTAADDSKVARGPLRQRIQGRRAAEPGPA